MALSGGAGHSRLFTLRVWAEEVNDGNIEWRGKVHHSMSGEQIYFRNWETLIAFLTREWSGSGGPGAQPGDKIAQLDTPDAHP